MLKDVSDDGSNSIQACLCDSDLCNNKVSSAAAVNNVEKTNNDETEIPDTDKDDIQYVDDTDPLSRRGSVTTEPTLANTEKKLDNNDVGVEETPRAGGGFKVNIENSLFFSDDDEEDDNEDVENAAAGGGDNSGSEVRGLQCYSCGSLLSESKNCSEFDASDPDQRQLCAPDEACLMYTWTRSHSERGELDHHHTPLTLIFQQQSENASRQIFCWEQSPIL